MKKLTLIVSALALVLGMSQCKKPDMPRLYSGHTQDITFSIGNGNGSKGDFEEGTTSTNIVLNYKWDKETDNDVLHVYGQPGGGEEYVSGTYLGALTLVNVTNGGLDAEFRGTLENVPDEGWLRFVHYGPGVDVTGIDDTGVTVDFSEQDGSLATISDKVVAYCDRQINGFSFSNCQLLVKFAIARMDLSDFSGDVDMSCILENGIKVSAGGAFDYIDAAHTTLKGKSNDYYVVMMPLDNTKPVKFCDGEKLGTYQEQIDGNGYYTDKYDPIKVSASNLVEGSIKGESFTVGPRESVHFSNGTLQWTATGTHEVASGETDKEGTWRFAEHQWDAIYGDNLYLGTSGYYMDLFGFGTSGYYQAPNKYDGSSTDYGNGQNDIAGTNYDWGVYNAISNAGNKPGLWRTLTNDEWVYLAYGRNNNPIYKSEGKHMTGVGALTLSDMSVVYGLFILPDKYYTKEGHKDFTANNGWEFTESEISNYSIIFSPAGGYRTFDGANVLIYDYNASKGYFHSSSARAGGDGLNYEQAFCVGLSPYVFFGRDDYRRQLGFFVRLVCE